MSAALGRLKQARAAGRSPEVRSFARGFTLLELLVAITVLSVVSVIAWRGLDSLTTTRERLEPEADDVRALLTTFGQMERDLAQVTNPKFLGLTTAPVNVSITDGAVMLQLARVAPSAPDRPTEVQTVYYRIVDGTLMRQASPALSAFETIPTERLESARLLDKVRLMQLRTWSPGVGWVDPNVPQQQDAGSAPQQGTGVVPGIEVTLERENGRIYRRVLLVGA
ncbi:MAG TPA: type II secretion system protein GspJ [Burkholderiaceae bacterium]|nr:type II secretion system protein GspJ [Burkholderiaceae bacterium]HQR72041.1 type II secretion system protein GspJ [Burkholderiaceae bacterium]